MLAKTAIEGLGGAVEAAFGALATIMAAQAQAQAEIVAAQQKTQQAAVQVNPGILHELDRPMLTIQGKLWGGKNAPTFNLNASLMDLYAFGDMAERIYYDIAEQYLEGRPPGMFSIEWDDIRAPRTQVAGTPSVRTGIIPEPAPAAAQPAAGPRRPQSLGEAMSQFLGGLF